MELDTSGKEGAPFSGRVLSYNFNILPRGAGGYQSERIDSFLECVGNYDVLLLQEVYASSIFPYALQRHFCHKKALLDGLKEKGFSHYVISRQPSYHTMLNYGVVSDNGLLIASRFPIWQRGTYTFRQRERGEQPMSKGLIFAEIELPGAKEGQHVVFFNVHLRPEDGALVESYQFNQLKRSITLVMNQLKTVDGTNAEKWLPFMIGGDFNIAGFEAGTTLPSKRFLDMASEFQSLGATKDAIFDVYGRNLPTRPAKRFFPTQSRLERQEAVPQRQDYLFVSKSVLVRSAKLDKFVAGKRRPYSYLSDHFGIAATIEVEGCNTSPQVERRPSKLRISSLLEEAFHESSNPTTSLKYELLPFALVVLSVFLLNFTYVVVIGFIWLVAHVLRYGIVSLPDEHYRLFSGDVSAGEKTISKGNFDSLNGCETVSQMWERCVSRFRTLKCLGYINDKSEVSWLTFGAVDTRVRIIALGLYKLGLQRGDIVGVQCEACVNGVLLELACAHLGVATFSLVGKGSVVRSLIDEYKMKIVFSGSGSVNMLLSCRSTVLETVVLMDNATSEENVVLGKDLNIELIPFIRLEHDGGAVLTGGVPKSQCDASSVFTYNLDNSSMDEVLTAVPMTHDDVLREIRILFASRVIPNGYKGDTIIWYSPFSGMFSRLAVIAILSQGNAVGCSSSNHLQEVFQKFKPTILVASPSLFKMSEIQLQRAMQRYSWLYNWMFRVSYNLRSRLIHVNRKDSSLLRFLFFRSSAAQLGGYIRKIVLCSSQETSLFDLIEHISVCYAPVVQEVTYQNRIGVCTVDSVPSPNLTVELDPIDPFCSKAGIGRLSVQKLESKEKYSLDIAAVWESTQSLVLLGPSQGILWPDNYQYAIAIQLERIFINSRFITNVFLYCEPCKPIVAVVHPNRDTLEFEWQQEGTEKGKHFAWRDLVDFAPSIIMKDFHKLAVDYKVNPSHVPEKVHLHPHSFRNHSTFFTPFGKLRRRNVKSYFNAVIDKMYGKSYDDLAELNMDHVSDSDCSLRTPLTGERAVLRVPFAIDIGGTFAKIVYISPPDRRLKPPPHFTHENSSLSETLNIRTSKFFSTDGGKSEVAAAGQLKFGKIPSSEIPNFVEFIKRSGVTQHYRREFIDHIRATGGGAFKYASLVKNSLNITLDIVKEMEAVVLGLNLIIKLAPSSIFMVEPATGRQLPHQLSVGASGELSPFPYLLINIGSGISFIKCTNESGAHVRVGGSPIGGATFWGLTKSLTNLTSWEEVLEIMRLDGPGDNKNVDLLVGDIYGFNAKDLPAMLSSETVASSFGKYGTDRFVDNTTAQDYNERGAQYLSPLSATGGDFSIHTKTSERSVGREEASSMDVVRSLLNMIAGNVTQLAYLHSKMHGVKNIFFAGGFVRDNPLVWNFISSTLLYWSSGECKAHFLQHDGYLGSLGCAVLGSTEADD